MTKSRRDQIIAAAIREFGAHRFENASVNRIIAEAGVSKGTFYHYFANKKELYFAIGEVVVAVKKRYFTAMIAELKQKETDLFDLLKLQVQAARSLMLDNPALYAFGQQLLKEDNPVKTEFYSRFQPDVGQAFQAVVQSAIDNGRLSDRYPMDFSARIIWHLMMHYDDVLFDSGEQPDPDQIEERLNLLIDFMKRGLGGPDGESGQDDAAR